MNESVQVVPELAGRADALHTNDFNKSGGSRVKFAVRAVAPVPAVSTPAALAETWAALAENWTEVFPAPTRTLVGTVRLALLLESGTLNPPAGALEEIVRTQVEDAGV